MQGEMSSTTHWLVSILGGELVTLLTGLLPTTPSLLVGATWYGFPLAWLIRMIVAPEYNPWRIELLNFLGDVIIWTIILAVVLFVIDKVRKPAKQ
jgi:cytochrome b subunit of formate dehydrogenase